MISATYDLKKAKTTKYIVKLLMNKQKLRYKLALTLILTKYFMLSEVSSHANFKI